ncbi:hypothetical protein [Stenotrophomonas sp. YIM B06876]|uniref:hypothetical protein n=1 Tax=Stenotrophomonas sp. YIM B06876 TaxID=3060211 RepID=UPI0027381DA9|nr:hypothetical protein [Stenotrophomonas sp. YIM B06876]
MSLQHSTRRSSALLGAGLFSLGVFQAHAGASLLVDDASITAHGHCQVESWIRAHSPGQELTSVPACNAAGIEFGLGYSHYTQAGTGNLWSLAAKHLFRDFDTQPWGLGLSVNAGWDGNAGRWTNGSVNLPLSIALDPDRKAVLHLNIGWSKPEAQPAALTGGIGSEWVLGPSWTLLAEMYAVHRGPTLAQLGLRHALSNATSLDVLAGHQRGQQGGSWLTLGLNFDFPR